MGNNPSAADMEEFMSPSTGPHELQQVLITKIQLHLLLSINLHCCVMILCSMLHLFNVIKCNVVLEPQAAPEI